MGIKYKLLMSDELREIEAGEVKTFKVLKTLKVLGFLEFNLHNNKV